MPYESQARQLARGAIKAHGDLKEVVFIEPNTNSLLIFSDGTVLSLTELRAGKGVGGERYAFPIAASLGGTNPFTLLAFGYSGTGPDCFSAFLEEAGFQDTQVGDIRETIKLLPDGRRIKGEIRENEIAWEDGTATSIQ